MPRLRWRVACLVMAFSTLLPAAAHAAIPTPKNNAEASRAEPVDSAVAAERRDELLGGAWRSSDDRAWTVSGDADGLHVLVAEARTGYQWRTASSLSEPGFEVDQWIGHGCVTGSGQRLVVVYAPRTFTNRAELFDRGAFTAVVDLESGQVRKLPVRSSLAYYNPGCGAGEKAIVTQEGGDALDKTRVLEVDAVTGALGKPIETPGQLTSAVPTPAGIVAADRQGLVRLAADGARRLVARSASVPFLLRPDSDGGVVYLDREGDQGLVRRLAADRGGSTTLAKGELTEIGLTGGPTGSVVITGKAQPLTSLPRTVSRPEVPKNTELSTRGGLALTRVADEEPATPGPHRVRISATVPQTGKQVEFSVDPAAVQAPRAGSGRLAHPHLDGGAPPPRGRDSGEPVEAERTCSVPRNDVRNQAMQPKPRQVEWAANQAVRNVLTVARPANWKNLGMPAYSPQGLFPPRELLGGGFIPAQVMLGILAQESNLWQASRHAMPGVTANPLIGNYYGIDYYNRGPDGKPIETDDWDIRWALADCGYGVSQFTDGMRLKGKEKEGETALPYQTQRAVALDFAANIAAGVHVLQDKWNQTRGAGLVINNGDSRYLENWFFAVWAYNSGFHPDRKDGSPWGVGWSNNPVNPKYPANRTPFLEVSYDDARVPHLWPYPEKVMGWAGHPLQSFEGPDKPIVGYRQAWWLGDSGTAVQNRKRVKPPATLFCDDTNWCQPGQKFVPDDPGEPGKPGSGVIGEPAGPCAHKSVRDKYDLKCWYNRPATWKQYCDQECGRETLRFDPGYAYQEDAASYPPKCDRGGLPDNAIVVDDVPDDAPVVRPECAAHQWRSEGEFTLDFASDAKGLYPSKVDFHQIGAGFGGHFWFGHTRKSGDEGGKLKTTGTWTLNRGLPGWTRVLVHLPDHGAHTQQAHYEIDTGTGSFTKDRYLSQAGLANRWVSLGVYQLSGTPRVRLSTVTQDGYGKEDVAYDAVAFQPLPGKPRHIVAALGDSFSSGEGAKDYYRETDNNHGTAQWAACRRSRNAWARKLVLPGFSGGLGKLADEWHPNAELGFIACSGAKSWHARGKAGVEVVRDVFPTSWLKPAEYETGDGQFREIAQVKSGVLDEHTTLVVLSIGGNDGDTFAKALATCVTPVSPCQDTLVRDWGPVIRTHMPEMVATVKEIAAKAPNAQIMLMGYPPLFSDKTTCAGAQTVSLEEAKAANKLAEEMANIQRAAVEETARRGIKVAYADSAAEFKDHGGCDETPYINNISIGPNGPGDFHSGDRSSLFCIPLTGKCISRESFHPNAVGTTGLAWAMEAALRRVRYGEPGPPVLGAG